jgi:glycosyltransferase involved in cell wall biosynthesis
MICRIIIPVLNEERSIVKVIDSIPKDIVDEIIVVDNGSTDNTKIVAREANATVLSEGLRGYGAACLKGIDYVKKLLQRPILLFFLMEITLIIQKSYHR